METPGWDPKWKAWLPKQNQTSSLVVDLVRHAHPRSVIGYHGDGRGYFQGPDDPLTEFGRYQARRLAEYIKQMGYSYRQVLVGTHKRQLQTWEIVRSVLPNVPVKVTPLLDERHIPPVLWGKSWDDPDPKIREINERRTALFYSYEPPHAGDENFFMLQQRVSRALDAIKLCASGRVLVLSSSATMKMLVALMVCGAPLTQLQYIQLDRFLSFAYASISTYQWHKGSVGFGYWERVRENHYDYLFPSTVEQSPS